MSKAAARRKTDNVSDLGFRKASSRSVQLAYYRHLVVHSKSASARNVDELDKPQEPLTSENSDAQLTFDPAVLGIATDRKR